MIRHARRILVLAVFALAGACTSGDIGPEYLEVSEEESKLQFYGPGLAGGYRLFLTGKDNHFVRRTIASYGPVSGEFPFARMYLAETPPTRHFTRVQPVKEGLEQWDWFRGKALEIGASGDTANAIGRIEYAAATADGIACVAWLQTFGPREGTGVGTRVLSGFYCKGKGTMPSTAESESIVRLIGHRTYGAIEPPAGWTASTASTNRTGSISIPIQVIWANDSSGVDIFGGRIRIPEGQENGVITLGAGAGRQCEGVVNYDKRESDRLFMRWLLTCANDLNASGTLTMKDVGGSTYVVGEGKDNRGRKVSLIE